MRCGYLGLMLLLATSLAWGQSVVDPNLQVQTWASGFTNPTGMAFLPGSTDAFVLEKNSGQVKLLQGQALGPTVLDLPVANDAERGLLGVALHPNFANNGNLYLYYTAAPSDGAQPTDNRIEKYHWDGSSLILKRTILSLPATPGPNHNGGKIHFGPDGKLYAVIGDLNRRQLTQNMPDTKLQTTSAILRLNPDGSAPTDNPFFNGAITTNRQSRLNLIFAYGVRNSFGMAFDPVSGRLWDTENGVDTFDEINLVKPGFNSGWVRIMGPSDRGDFSPAGLVSLGPSAKYMEPRFSWAASIAPTAMQFVKTDILGPSYANDMLAGDFLTGTLFHFKLDDTRKQLVLNGALSDKVADNTDADLLAEQDAVILGSDFGALTEIVSQPDAVYLLSFTNGTVYRLTQVAASLASQVLAARGSGVQGVPEPAGTLLLGVLLLSLSRRTGRWPG